MTRKFLATKLDEMSALADEALNAGEGIRLPDSIPYLYWTHTAGSKAKEPWDRGGWNCPEDVMDKAIEDGRPVPSYFQLFKNDYGTVYHSRSIIIAPFAKRERWIDFDSKEAKSHYFEGARLHRQVVAALADIVDGKLEFWGIVYITAKGTIWKSFDQAQKDFAEATKQARKDFSEKNGLARTLSANLLFRTVGDITGKVQTVGRGNSTSQVSVMEVKLKKDYSVNDIEILIIPDEAFEAMASFMEEHQDWLHAWDDGGETASAQDVTTITTADENINEETPF